MVSDREVASGVMMLRLFDSIYSADLVIADLTYQNPNVYYELGLRHALRPRGTLLMRRTGGDRGVQRLGPRKRGAVADTAYEIRGVTICSYEPTLDKLAAGIDGLRTQIERVVMAIDQYRAGLPGSAARCRLRGRPGRALRVRVRGL